MERAGGHDSGPAAVTDAPADASPRHARPRDFIKLARVHQWSKSAFVLIGPFYWLQDAGIGAWREMLVPALLTAAAFALASSGCYVFNDLADAEADRAHPRKRRRPIASGVIKPPAAVAFGCALILAAIGLVLLMPAEHAIWVGLLLAAHVLNVTAYSVALKHRVIADVISLSMGFVFRVMAGCAAVGIEPTTWLLNVTLFLSMLLAFGKRLGERRSMGSAEDAAKARLVQTKYSDDLLRMLVVVTAVGTLLTYAGYVGTRDAEYQFGFNLLWLTILPATYGLLRAITLLERGDYDDPTELAIHDRPFAFAGLCFVLLTGGLLLARHLVLSGAGDPGP